MKKVFPLVVVLVVVVVATYVQGKWSERWGKVRTEQLNQFTSRLSEVPKTIGDWEGTDEEVDEKQFARSNCDGQVSRKYENRRNGSVVSVYLVSGTGRHVTIHTPDWCYRGAGYDMDNQPIAYSIPVEGLGTNPEFRTTTFTKHEATGMTDRLRIFWSFTDDGVWHGPASPKPMYGTQRALQGLLHLQGRLAPRESRGQSHAGLCQAVLSRGQQGPLPRPRGRAERGVSLNRLARSQRRQLV